MPMAAVALSRTPGGGVVTTSAAVTATNLLQQRHLSTSPPRARPSAVAIPAA
jgi:hypothetical protein